MVQKIPYFEGLGVTAVELMSVHESGEDELVRANPMTGERLKNYWGYIGSRSARSKVPTAAGDARPAEARIQGNGEMSQGPTLCFRGTENGGNEDFTDEMMSAIGFQFGGHVEKAVSKPGAD